MKQDTSQDPILLIIFVRNMHQEGKQGKKERKKQENREQKNKLSSDNAPEPSPPASPPPGGFGEPPDRRSVVPAFPESLAYYNIIICIMINIINKNSWGWNSPSPCSFQTVAMSISSARSARSARTRSSSNQKERVGGHISCPLPAVMWQVNFSMNFVLELSFGTLFWDTLLSLF